MSVGVFVGGIDVFVNVKVGVGVRVAVAVDVRVMVGVTPGGRPPNAWTGGSVRVKMSVFAKTHQLTYANTKMAARAIVHLMADFGMLTRGVVRGGGVAVTGVRAAFGNKRSPCKKMGQRM